MCELVKRHGPAFLEISFNLPQMQVWEETIVSIFTMPGEIM